MPGCLGNTTPPSLLCTTTPKRQCRNAHIFKKKNASQFRTPDCCFSESLSQTFTDAVCSWLAFMVHDCSTRAQTFMPTDICFPRFHPLIPSLLLRFERDPLFFGTHISHLVLTECFYLYQQLFPPKICLSPPPTHTPKAHI